jgi:hypothetical protein
MMLIAEKLLKKRRAKTSLLYRGCPRFLAEKLLKKRRAKTSLLYRGCPRLILQGQLWFLDGVVHDIEDGVGGGRLAVQVHLQAGQLGHQSQVAPLIVAAHHRLCIS